MNGPRHARRRRWWLDRAFERSVTDPAFGVRFYGWATVLFLGISIFFALLALGSHSWTTWASVILNAVCALFWAYWTRVAFRAHVAIKEQKAPAEQEGEPHG